LSITTVVERVVRRVSPGTDTSNTSRAAISTALVVTAAAELPLAVAPVLAAGAVSVANGGRPSPAALGRGALIGGASGLMALKIWPRVAHEQAAAVVVRPVVDVLPSVDGDGLVLVVNPSSGPNSADDALVAIHDALPAAEIVELQPDDDIVAVLDEAAGRARVLGVMGGDGTINAGASAALTHHLPLAVIPGGTLNHFARDLGVDTTDEAIEAIRTGDVVEVDVGLIDGNPFLNTASFGTYSEFVQARERHERRLGKWPAVVVALVSTLREGTPTRAVIDGTTREVWMIFFGNCAYDPPGFAPTTRARLDDGDFDVRIVDGSHPWARSRLVAAVLLGRLAKSRVYRRWTAASITVDTDGPTSHLATDGEIFDGAGRFVVEKSPTRLLVIAPHQE